MTPDAADTPTPPPELAWSSVLEQHPLPHLVFDLHSLRMLAANAAAVRRYGHPLPELLQLTRLDLLVPEDGPRLVAFLAGLPDSAQVQPQPVWHERTRDGRVLVADIRGQAVTWQGRPARLSAVLDATERAALATEAGRTRDLLGVAGRVARVGGWYLDLDAQRTRWSDLVCELHEVQPGSSASLDEGLAFYPPEAREQLVPAVQRCISHGTAFDLALPFVGARGTARWVRAAGEAVRDASGRVVGLQGALQDITQAHRNEQALQATRDRLAALVKANPDLWMVWDEQLHYREVSDPAHPCLSAPWAEKLGRPVGETLPPALAQDVQRLTRAAHAEGRPREHLYGMTLRDGRHRDFEARYVPLPDGHTMALVRDITGVRQLERRFQVMADSAPIGIFLVDEAGACTYVNADWCALFGMSADAARGKGWAANVTPSDREAVARLWREAAANGQPFELEFGIQAPGRPARRVWSQARPLVDAGGRASGYVGAVVDVTQARELEEARQAAAVAREAGRRQTAFLSRVSHELRTPLNAILGFGELLLHDGGTQLPQAPAYLRHVVDAGRHMLALVDDLLELQRIEQDRMELHPQPLDLVALLAACTELLQPAAAAAGVALQVQVPPGTQAWADERSLRQIVLNLGSNAIKYGAGPVRLTADVQGGGARVQVHDNGPGLAPEAVERLFQPFERLGQERRGIRGSGLGLVISRQLARAMGGDLQLHSAAGQGTTAWLRLPLPPA